MSSIITIQSLFVPVSKIRSRQTFYSFRDGNWNDPSIWLSNRYGLIPGADDDVYINNVVTLNTSSSGNVRSVNNLFITGTLKATNSVTLNVLGNIKSDGAIDFTNSNINLALYGWDNYITSFTKGNSTVTYTSSVYQQNIMELDYNSLTIANRGTKILSFDLVLSGNFNVSNTDFDLTSYSLYVAGSTGFSGNATFRKTGPGSITFIGPIFEPGYGDTFDFSGNPSIEMQGGWGMLANLNTGGGLVSFTQSQYIYSRGNYAVFNLQNGVIYGGVTLRLYCESYIENINGNAPTAVFQCDKGTYAPPDEFRKTVHYTGFTQPMKLGVLDCTTYQSIFSYSRNGDQEVKGTTYDNLILTGSGIKKLMGDVTVPAAQYTLSGTAILDTNGFNLNLI